MSPDRATADVVTRTCLAVAELHAELARNGLVAWTSGNISARVPGLDLLVIKPSGVAYASLRPQDMVVVDLGDGRVVEGELRPSSDTPTHLALYRRFPTIGGVVHTHSSFAAAWAQARASIPALGTTHADHFDGAVPVTRELTAEEIGGAYEAATGDLIAETILALGLDPLHMPAALVASHGPFTWGADAPDAVTNAIALEAVAAMAHRTLAIDPAAAAIAPALLERHFSRKHGPSAYYGQPKGE
jgi:L-ribulose-5-phosphate 4-epimerase